MGMTGAIGAGTPSVLRHIDPGAVEQSGKNRASLPRDREARGRLIALNQDLHQHGPDYPRLQPVRGSAQGYFTSLAACSIRAATALGLET
jgi:hypothetical protein